MRGENTMRMIVNPMDLREADELSSLKESLVGGTSDGSSSTCSSQDARSMLSVPSSASMTKGVSLKPVSFSVGEESAQQQVRIEWSRRHRQAQQGV